MVRILQVLVVPTALSMALTFTYQSWDSSTTCEGDPTASEEGDVNFMAATFTTNLGDNTTVTCSSGCCTTVMGELTTQAQVEDSTGCGNTPNPEADCAGEPGSFAPHPEDCYENGAGGGWKMLCEETAAPAADPAQESSDDAGECAMDMTACSATCPGAPAMFGGMSNGVTMGYMCDNAADMTCTMGEAACCMDSSMGMVLALCTVQGRRPIIQSMLADADACATACPGVVDGLGAFMAVNTAETMRYCGENACDDGRRLAGHGRDTRERHALLEVLCPIETEVTCFFIEDNCPLSAMGEAMMGDLRMPIVMDSCNVPMAVTVALELTVDDPAAFVAHEGSESAVAAGIAAAAAVDVREVSVELSVARRLEDFQNLRRLEGAVNVAATIITDSTDSVATLQATVNAIQPAAMATHLNEALSGAGVGSVTVASLAAEAAPAAAPAPTEDAALKTTVAFSVLVALSAQFGT